MLNYKVYQNKSKGNTSYGKWFARATVNETIDINKLAEHMSNHHTPYSKGAIMGVLTDMVNCIHELVPDGRGLRVELADTQADGVVERCLVNDDQIEYSFHNFFSFFNGLNFSFRRLLSFKRIKTHKN